MGKGTRGSPPGHRVRDMSPSHSQSVGKGRLLSMVLLCPFGDEGAKEVGETPSGLSGHSEGPCDQ